MKIKISLSICLLCISLGLFAQQSKLAQQYYADGEYEKAAALFQKLYDSNRQNDFYFNRYVDCLIALERFDEGEAVLRKQIKKKPKDVQLLVQHCVKLKMRDDYDPGVETTSRSVLESLSQKRK